MSNDNSRFLLFIVQSKNRFYDSIFYRSKQILRSSINSLTKKQSPKGSKNSPSCCYLLVVSNFVFKYKLEYYLSILATEYNVGNKNSLPKKSA